MTVQLTALYIHITRNQSSGKITQVTSVVHQLANLDWLSSGESAVIILVPPLIFVQLSLLTDKVKSVVMREWSEIWFL